MTSVSNYVYIGKLADIVNEYSNTCHRAIKMESINVKRSTYIDFGIKNNHKYPKFEVGDHVKMSKYENVFV